MNGADRCSIYHNDQNHTVFGESTKNHRTRIELNASSAFECQLFLLLLLFTAYTMHDTIMNYVTKFAMQFACE